MPLCTCHCVYNCICFSTSNTIWVLTSYSFLMGSNSKMKLVLSGSDIILCNVTCQYWWLKNFVPHCPEGLRYAKVWGRDIVRNLTLAYAKRLFPDSNPWTTSHQVLDIVLWNFHSPVLLGIYFLPLNQTKDDICTEVNTSAHILVYKINS